MDGNGRWAKQKGLPRIMGHREGTESVRDILKACQEFGVKYLTIYTFSTENWRRPKEEVDFLMELFAEKIESEMDELMGNKVKVNFLGRLQGFPQQLHEKMQGMMVKTKNNDGVVLNIMVNYGGRAEIVDAVQAVMDEGRKTIDEKTIEAHLYTAGMPDPDLLIRTASEMRVSNFLLWQIAYTEIYVTDLYWPDFRKPQLKEAIEDYQKRVRKFGQTAEQLNAD
ncbi:MAG: polyprenyl diphosphate synthase [bacterium]